MKLKILALLIAISLLCLTAACGGSPSPADDGASQETAGDTAPPAAVGGTATGDAIYEGEGTVYMAIPDGSIARYLSFDVPFVEKWLAVYAPNMKLQILDPESDSQKQLQLIEGAISSGCDFMIYMPAEEYGASGALQLLQEEGIPFTAMVHTPYGGPCDMMVTMPFPSIAEMYLDYMEENLLPAGGEEPLKVACIWGATGYLFYNELTETYYNTLNGWVADGRVELVFEADSSGWTAADAQPLAEQMLTQTGNDVDVILTMNDDLLTGIVAALSEQGIVHQVALLGGCDSTIQGLARVQEGWQVGDVLPDYEGMAQTVARVAATWLATGEAPLELCNGATENEFMEGGIPTIFIDAVMITPENIRERVIDAGVASQDAIEAIAATLRG